MVSIFFFRFLRKLRSIIAILVSRLSTGWLRFLVFGNSAISMGPQCSFGRGVSLRATDGGSISLGRGVSLSDHVKIVARRGRVVIADGVFIGDGSIIVSHECIVIGEKSLIAEYVVIRDQDHRTDTMPLSQSGFYTSPINIGRDTWIGCKVSILRGSCVGNCCVIGAHALVNSNIPDGTLSVGVPARVLRQVNGILKIE